MAKKTGAAKKAIWKGMAKQQKYFAFMLGEDYARSPEMYDFANQLRWSCDCTNKIPASMEGRIKRFTEWDGKNVVKFMIELTNMVFECCEKSDGQKIQDLGKAITAQAKKISNSIDPEREWLMSYLYGLEIFQEGGPSSKAKKSFAEIRKAFYRKFPDTTIDDSDLRNIITKDVEYIYRRGKPGPKGPRVKH